MKVITVEVKHTVEVVIDDSKLTSEFMNVFREDFYNFHTVEDHAAHIAQLKVRELIGIDGFIEGYGDMGDMGITVEVLGQAEEIL